MSTRDIGIFGKRLEEALAFNQPLLPILALAAKEGITILFEPWVENEADMLVIRMSKKENGETIGAQILINPETLRTTVFYPKRTVPEQTSFSLSAREVGFTHEVGLGFVPISLVDQEYPLEEE